MSKKKIINTEKESFIYLLNKSWFIGDFGVDEKCGWLFHYMDASSRQFDTQAARINMLENMLFILSWYYEFEIFVGCCD